MNANKISKFLIIASVPLVATIGPIFSVGPYVTSIYVPLFFITSLLSNKNGYFLKFTPVKLYLLYFLLSLGSFYNAISTEYFLGNVKTQLGGIIFAIAVFNYILIDTKNVKYFFFSCILNTYIFSFYLFNSGTLNLNIDDNLNYRLDDEAFNSNAFAYYIFLASFAFFFLFQLLKSKIIKYVYFLSLILYIYIILSSGSRGGLIIFILIQILYCFYIGTGKVRSVFKFTVKLLLALLISLPLLIQLTTLILEETLIGKRFDVLAEEGESTIRVTLVRLAFEKFQEYPFFGVGSGNFRLHNKYGYFSHNNFAEILVTNGMFCFGVYVLMFIVVIQNVRTIRKRINHPDEKKNADIIILFFLGFCIYSIFYVFTIVIPFTGFIFALFAMIYIMDYNIKKQKDIT